MPVLGSPTGTSSAQVRGVHLPTGSLDVWKAARNASATTRTEVVIFGDSTTFGSATGTIPFYSWVQKIRALSIAAGYTDGGRGIAGLSDTAAMSGPENIPIVQSMNPANSWVSSGDGNDVLLSETPTSTANGAAVVFQGYGTAARLHYTKMSTVGSFTYAIDGGTTTTVNANIASGFGGDTIYLPLGGTDTTLHTVRVVNTGTSQRASVVAEFLKTSGIVYQKQAISGIATNSFFGRANTTLGNYAAQLALGLTPGTSGSANSYGWGMPAGAKPQYRNPSLAICALGVNNLQGLSITTEGAPTSGELTAAAQAVQGVVDDIGNFVRLARAAGADPLVVVPHFDMAAHGHTWGGEFSQAVWATGVAHGCAVVDFNQAIRPVSTMEARGLGTPSVHADYRAYDAEATFLWNNALSL